jgi:hypothetical protein
MEPESLIFKFPQAAEVDRVIHKSKIYEKAGVPARYRHSFTNQIEKITWKYKLSPLTVNTPAAQGIEEIQIFQIDLKTEDLEEELIRMIDKSIPSPVIFQLCYSEKIKYMAAWKRRNEGDHSKNVISRYFSSHWSGLHTTQFLDLPVVTDLARMYDHLIRNLIPMEADPDTSVPELIEKYEDIQKLEKDIKLTEKRLNREKQFNRKIILHVQLKDYYKKLKEKKNNEKT